jgi:hypothetical protein
MALIRDGRSLALEGIVVQGARPALLIRNDRIEQPSSGYWESVISRHAENVARAIRGTARLEIPGDPVSPYVGTAFIVGPRLAAIARHMAEILLQKVRERAFRDGTGYPQLNFYAEHGSEMHSSVGARVILVHPYFDFALLALDEEVETNRILSLAAAPPAADERIFLVGYPAFDVRNDRALMDRIFGGIYEVKRFMPGQMMEWQKPVLSFGNEVDSLVHDASTLGGTAGAPVVSFETGQVVGVNFGGQFKVANYAVPAWELARDPHVRLAGVQFSDGSPSWLQLWQTKPPDADGSPELPDTDEEDLPRQIVGGETDKALQNIFTFDQIVELHEHLINARFVTEDSLANLFNGLPLEFQASLPGGETLSDKLLARLNYFNRFGGLIPFENHTPFYIILVTAKALRRAEPATVAVFNRFLDFVQKAETKAAKKSEK